MFVKMRINLTILTALLVTGCTFNSQVQYSYDVDRDECKMTAQTAVDSGTAQTKSRASALKTEFERCMRKNGWKLTSAKPPTTQTQPIWTPSGPGVNPVAAAAPASTTAAARSAAPAAATTSAAPASAAAPATVAAPAPLAPAAPAASVPAGASTYQPATPPAGVAPGRYFGPR